MANRKCLRYAFSVPAQAFFSVVEFGEANRHFDFDDFARRVDDVDAVSARTAAFAVDVRALAVEIGRVPLDELEGDVALHRRFLGRPVRRFQVEFDGFLRFRELAFVGDDFGGLDVDAQEKRFSPGALHDVFRVLRGELPRLQGGAGVPLADFADFFRHGGLHGVVDGELRRGFSHVELEARIRVDRGVRGLFFRGGNVRRAAEKRGKEEHRGFHSVQRVF